MLGHIVEPLVLAHAAFPRLGEVSLSATSTLRLAFRIFDPLTRLLGAAACEKGLATLVDVLCIHSKLLIVDDRVAQVSSANLNGRSLRMDTEAGVTWRGSGVADFRQRLWAQHVGKPTPSGATSCGRGGSALSDQVGST